MISVEHTVLLTVGFLPYLALGLYDSWMHGTARRVPVLEKILHALVGLSLTALWIGLLRHPCWVIPALTVFIVVGAWDELGYHGHLAPIDAYWGARYAEVDDPNGNIVGLQSPIDPGRAGPPPGL